MYHKVCYKELLIMHCALCCRMCLANCVAGQRPWAAGVGVCVPPLLPPTPSSACVPSPLDSLRRPLSHSSLFDSFSFLILVLQVLSIYLPFYFPLFSLLNPSLSISIWRHHHVTSVTRVKDLIHPSLPETVVRESMGSGWVSVWGEGG